MAALLLSAADMLDEASQAAPAIHDDWRWCDVCGVWVSGDWQEHMEGSLHHHRLGLDEVCTLCIYLTGMHLLVGHLRRAHTYHSLTVTGYNVRLVGQATLYDSWHTSLLIAGICFTYTTYPHLPTINLTRRRSCADHHITSAVVTETYILR